MMSTEMQEITRLRKALDMTADGTLASLVNKIPSGDARNEITTAAIHIRAASDRLKYALLGRPMKELRIFEHDEKLLDQMVHELDGTHWFMHSDPVMCQQIKDLMKTYAMQMLRRYGS